MTRRATGLAVLLSLAAAHGGALAAEKSLKVKEQEAALLREYVADARDSLQMEVARRYAYRQQALQQRQTDAEELERLNEQQERLLNELARLKEEALAREQRLQDETRAAAAKREEWAQVRSTLEGLLRRDADELVQVFPLDREQRRGELETVRREFAATVDPGTAWARFVGWRMAWLDSASAPRVCHALVMPDSGAARTMAVARLGNVFAYCLDSAATPFMIRQTGRLGGERYAIERVGSEELAAFIAEAVPQWLAAGAVGGAVLTEVMQNEQSRALVAGRAAAGWHALHRWFRAGGPVMVPLALISLWALVLMVYKLVVFSRKHTASERLYRTVLTHLERGEVDQARACARSHRGVVAKVAQICLEHVQWSRDSAEKAVRELLVQEVPQLNRHLNSLAVIANAAPLLGLLGTVTGMINLFEVITHYGTGDPRLLARGISEALVTTEMGLIIAVPVVLIHNFLRNRRDDMQAEMEKHAISILNKLWP